MRPLDRVAGMALLKSCGVQRVYRLNREEPPPMSATATTVFMVKADLASAKVAVDMIRAKAGHVASHQDCLAHIICVPKALHR